MSKATAHTKEVEQVVKVKTGYYTLELSKEEAQTLYDILQRIGGDYSTRRQYADLIRLALHDVGFLTTSKHDFDDKYNALYFINPNKKVQSPSPKC